MVVAQHSASIRSFATLVASHLTIRHLEGALG
jgi:hypothetical protein